jgi:hypothetical protein
MLKEFLAEVRVAQAVARALETLAKSGRPLPEGLLAGLAADVRGAARLLADVHHKLQVYVGEAGDPDRGGALRRPRPG